MKFFFKKYLAHSRASSRSRAYSKGSSLAEVLVAGAIILIVLTGLYATHTFFVTQTQTNTQKIKVSFLLEEGVEAVKTMRDLGWTNISGLTANQPYYLTFTGGRWSTTTTATRIDNVYYRSFVVQNVNRASDDDITTTGGSSDAGTRKLTVTVSWPDRGATTTRSISTYIANII